MVQEQGCDSFVDFVSAVAIGGENSGTFARSPHRVGNRPFFYLGFAGQRTTLFMGVSEGNYEIDIVGRNLIHAFGRAT